MACCRSSAPWIATFGIRQQSRHSKVNFKHLKSAVHSWSYCIDQIDGLWDIPDVRMRHV